jgi:ferredoxin-NADP reductase
MAVARTARVVRASKPCPDSRLLELDLLDGPLDFAGGQYIIIDSGKLLPNGKAAKRAYSILSADGEQRRITLAAMRIGEGPCSTFLGEVSVGTTFNFSGPWGKLKVPESAASGRTLVLASDTGITAALGLLRGQAFAARLPHAELWWLRSGARYLFDPDWLRTQLPGPLGSVHFGTLPADPNPERATIVAQLVQELGVAAPIEAAFLCGDGAINRAATDALLTAGLAPEHCLSETFFNGQKKS